MAGASSSSTPLDGFLESTGPLQGDSVWTAPMKVYDVFINHRGPDVKKTLVSHLSTALKRVNFSCFVDHKEIQIGDFAKDTLKNAIQHSKIHIAIFSSGYAESEWCLDELRFIMECFHERSCNERSPNHLFLPVFFHVIPSDLRLLTPSRESCYSSSFQKHAEKIEASVINKWKKALHEAADVKGFIFPDDFKGYEAMLVDGVVSKVIQVLSRATLLHVPKHPVGVDEKLQKALDHNMEKVRGWRGDSVQKLGIYGMGGVGKTTLAKLIYNRTHREFQSACFMENVSEICQRSDKGLVGLQQDLLQELLKPCAEIRIANTALGKQMMRERLMGRKVLVILDDVTEKKQLDELMPPYDCHLGEGSQVVITTRDQQILNWARAERLFAMEPLSKDLACQLFSLHAFPTAGESSSTYVNQLQSEMISEDQKILAEKVSDACQGLPLALEVLGSYLQDKDRSEWDAVVMLLEKNKMGHPLESEVTSKLRISFDALCNAEKDMFLDIACFMLQEHRDKAMRIWRSDFGDAKGQLSLENLVRKSLVKVDENGNLTMHDLLRDMGRQIVDNSCRHYWERSHLWREEEVESVLRKSKGRFLSCVRGLSSSVEREWWTSSFRKMDELKLLVLDKVTLAGDFSELSDELRWLQLRNCHLDQIPLLLQFDKLAVLDLEGSKITSFSCGDYMLQNLRELNLRDCLNLVEILIDFTRSSKSLEALLLSGCVNLEQLPESIVELSSSLVYLNLSRCSKLALPEGIGKLTTLGTLQMRDMVNLVSLPCSISLLFSLKVLNVEGCSSLCEIRELPSSLASLSVRGCTGLKYLDSSGFCESGYPPDGLESLCNLSHLDLLIRRELPLPSSSSLSDNLHNRFQARDSSSKRLRLPSVLTEVLVKLTSLKTLSFESSRIDWNLNFVQRPWLERMASLEDVVVRLSKMFSKRWQFNPFIDPCSTMEVVVPESYDINACSEVVCWFPAVGISWDESRVDPADIVGALCRDDQCRAAMDVEVVRKDEGGRQKFYQQLMCSQDEGVYAYMRVFRSSHPLMASLRGGDTIRVHSQHVKFMGKGDIRLIFGLNHMQRYLQHLSIELSCLRDLEKSMSFCNYQRGDEYSPSLHRSFSKVSISLAAFEKENTYSRRFQYP